MNYISFSLWGDKPIYNVGAIRNAELWKEHYPSWKMVVYYDNSVPVETLYELTKLGVMIIDMTEKNIYGMFWRFFAVEIDDAEYCIFRDCDSRIGVREKLAVEEWLLSGKTLHVMRDHPAHRVPYGNHKLGILGGMWGIKCKAIPIPNMIINFIKDKKLSYGSDQTFLSIVYSVLENDRYTHDEFFEKKPFPIMRENGRFIGERINEFEKPLTDDHKILLK